MPEEHLELHPGCIQAPGSSTGNAAGPASAALAGAGFTRRGRGWVPPPRTREKSSSCFLSKLLGSKKLLGSSEQSTPAASSPASKDTLRERLPSPPPCACPPTMHAGMVAQVHSQVPPQSMLLRDQQKPLAERLACGNLDREAVCSERSCMPQRLDAGGHADHTACRHCLPALQTQLPPRTWLGPAGKFKATRTKPPVCFPAQSA